MTNKGDACLFAIPMQYFSIEDIYIQEQNVNEKKKFGINSMPIIKFHF